MEFGISRMNFDTPLIIIVVAGLAAIFLFINYKFGQIQRGAGQQMGGELRTLHERLDRQAQLWSEHLQNISRQFGSVGELGRQMRDFQEFLRAPKLRGNIGEQILKDILEQALPKDLYEFQHRFKDGSIVDAIIKTDKGLIPIDAKFPLEQFRAIQKAKTDDDAERSRREFGRDVKKHLDAISEKYIQPAEGTTEYALMYVPSETVYYEIIRDEADLNNYAVSRHVTMVSPNTFHFVLGVFLATLRGQEMAKVAKEMQAYLAQLSGEARKFRDQLDLTSKHLGNAKNALDTASGQFGKLEERIDDVKKLKAGS